DIPSSLFIRQTNSYIFINYAGQPPTCLRCGGANHKRRNCTELKASENITVDIDTEIESEHGSSEEINSADNDTDYEDNVSEYDSVYGGSGLSVPEHDPSVAQSAEHRQTGNNMINSEPDQLPQEETTDGVAIVAVCETKCAENQGVEEHTAVHTEEKPNNSKNGDSKTGKQVNNEDLITGHTSVKSPAYTEYKNTLKGENYLNEHTAVHTDGKPLQCTKSGDTKSEKNSQTQLETHRRNRQNMH
ncbi:unnamed protein product, partial [Meganyctiphanes norvegica]